MDHVAARPRKLGGMGEEASVGTYGASGLDSAPSLNSCVLAQVILPQFTKPLVGSSGCQALWAWGFREKWAEALATPPHSPDGLVHTSGLARVWYN